MTTIQESNQASYRRLHEAINSRDLDLIARTVDDVFHANAVFHAGAPTAAPASQAVKGVWAMLLRAFPDIHVEIEDTVVEGDLASDATVWTAGFAVSSIAAAGGLEVTEDGQIVVDRTMRSHPNVYAVGDSVHTLGDNGRQLPMNCGSAGYTGRQPSRRSWDG